MPISSVIPALMCVPTATGTKTRLATSTSTVCSRTLWVRPTARLCCFTRAHTIRPASTRRRSNGCGSVTRSRQGLAFPSSSTLRTKASLLATPSTTPSLFATSSRRECQSRSLSRLPRTLASTESAWGCSRSSARIRRRQRGSSPSSRLSFGRCTPILPLPARALSRRSWLMVPSRANGARSARRWPTGSLRCAQTCARSSPLRARPRTGRT
mmetsp:Transcript_26209/g.52536  ORF Transcript_26209/g.52536 Transcript_26209/m.52536 type:complete len:212 (-) Transcript_26209:462-1097(-)